MVVTLSGELSEPDKQLSIPELVAVARDHEPIALTEGALDRVHESRANLEARIEDGEVIYGVSTGFGANADESIGFDDIDRLQENLIRSHAFAVGDELATDEVRAMMLLRLNSLLSGNSGIRTTVIETLRDVLNEGVHPCVPRKGSVSASGDLAPLAHMTLVLIGEGEARYDGERLPGEEALAMAGVEPLSLKAKEGLALVNGTNMITGIAALAVHDAQVIMDTADTIGTLSLEANCGISDPFRPEIHELRGHQGQQISARRIREGFAGSNLVTPAAESESVQDEYSLRCMPQVHGVTRDVIDHARDVVTREMNAVTDNPLVLSNGDVVSGGNFHGQPVALALDSLAIAIAELASISERRIFQLTSGSDTDARTTERDGDSDPGETEQGLPPFLVDTSDAEPGLNSGFMIPQVTAAALVSENKTLAHPDSTDSVPTSDNQEDHVSMGANAANHLTEILDNVTTVLGIEAFAAFQGLHLRDGTPGERSQTMMETLGNEIEFLARDRVMTDDLKSLKAMIRRGEFQ